MTRGREENRVLVVTEQRKDEHELDGETPPLEVLESILRHQGADRSAHDVLRASLAGWRTGPCSATSSTKPSAASTSSPARTEAPRSPR